MKILVFAECRNKKVKGTAGELLTEARRLAGGDASQVHAVIMGEGARDCANTLASFGAAKVIVVDAPETKLYQSEAYVQAMHQVCASGGYALVMGPASAMGRDFFPRLAARNKAAMLTDVVKLSVDGNTVVATRPMYAGKCLAEVASKSAMTFVTVRPNVMAAQVSNAGATATVEEAKINFDAGKIKAKIVEVRQGKSEKPDLTEASIIISGGRALANADNFKILHSVANVIGATVGASRAAVDSGYAPHDMQVGQTGKTVNPNLYIACGISGSIQHLAGMRTSKVIVAINTDPSAPIFTKADYGIVGDLFQVVPVLESEFKKLLEH